MGSPVDFSKHVGRDTGRAAAAQAGFGAQRVWRGTIASSVGMPLKYARIGKSMPWGRFFWAMAGASTEEGKFFPFPVYGCGVRPGVSQRRFFLGHDRKSS